MHSARTYCIYNVQRSFIIPSFVAAFKSEVMMNAQTGSLTFTFLTFMARHVTPCHAVQFVHELRTSKLFTRRLEAPSAHYIHNARGTCRTGLVPSERRSRSASASA